MDGRDGETVRGYEQFLAAASFDAVARAAQPCPLVYLTAAEAGGLALVVRDGDVEHIALVELTAEALRDYTKAHFRAYTAYQTDRELHRSGWWASLDHITAWLWNAAMGPVLDRLGGVEEAVFIPGGLLGLLPLHAAWTTNSGAPTGRRYAIDMLAISYVPNARSLQVAREIASEVPMRRLFALVEPGSVPRSPLPCAAYEVMAAQAAFREAATVLRRGEATQRAFERFARNADVLHLACHGFADLTDPLKSSILLAGNQPLLLQDLLNRQLRARLVVLSACETALPGTELPDEVVSLPTGMLQAGVAGVVASQWSVPDRATAVLMTEFYRRWRGGTVSPAHALRAAQQWMRDTSNDEKYVEWEAAVADQADWLPPPVAEEFLDALAYLEPDEHPHSPIHLWAAFAHVGA